MARPTLEENWRERRELAAFDGLALLTSTGHDAFVEGATWLGYLDSNQEQKNQNLPCCQLHHTPMAQTEARTTVYFSAR